MTLFQGILIILAFVLVLSGLVVLVLFSVGKREREKEFQADLAHLEELISPDLCSDEEAYRNLLETLAAERRAPTAEECPGLSEEIRCRIGEEYEIRENEAIARSVAVHKDLKENPKSDI